MLFIDPENFCMTYWVFGDIACSFISDEMEQGGPDSEAISPEIKTRLLRRETTDPVMNGFMEELFF